MIKVEIDAAALRHNWARARKMCGARRAFAVVKNDAYGHGLRRAADALRDDADGFAVCELDDALALRAACDKPALLLMGVDDEAGLRTAAQHRLWVAAHCARQIEMLCAAPAGAGLGVFLKIDTGMGRLGIAPKDAPAAAAALRAAAGVDEVTMMTHFACADLPDGVEAQMRVFQQAGFGSNGGGGDDAPFSVCNSAAAMLHDIPGESWARLGIALYGASPAPAWKTRDQLGLRAAMRCSAKIIAVKTLPAGSRAGYGGRFCAPHDLPLAIVAAGYGEGYPFGAHIGAPVFINGARAKVAGRVSMNMIAVDCSALPQPPREGDEAVLWGPELPAEEVAAAANTIAYNLFTALRWANS